MNDRQLEQVARRLGARAGDRVDVDQTATSVVARLKREPEREKWWRRHMPVLGAVAAAAVMVLWIGILSDSGEARFVEGQGLALAQFGLQAMSDEELEEVFDSLVFDAPVSELATAGLEEMSVGQLEELLQTMMED